MLRGLIFLSVYFLSSINVGYAQITNEELKNHEARKAHSYINWRQRPLFMRVSPASEILVDYLRKDNELNGYPEIPVSKKCDDLFMADLRGALEELPEAVKKHIRDHLVGIFTVSNLGTTGYTEILYNFDVNRLGFIVLDVDYLKRSANDWATWKENSPFRSQGAYRIKATIEPKDSDNRKQAIQFILTHEIGHLVGAVNHLHPNWFIGGDPEEFAFTKISWIKKGDKVISKFDHQFLLRKDIGYYRFDKSPLSADRILDCYRQLEDTDFSSLYAATNMWDDFAETFVIFVHNLLQKKPWKIEIIRNNSSAKTYKTSLMTDQGRVKKKFMEDFIRGLN